jgi:hypothetical protein
VIAHWDDVESGRAEAGHIAGIWMDLGSAAGTKTVGVSRSQVDPGKWSTPLRAKVSWLGGSWVEAGTGIRLEDLDYDDGEPR